MHVSLFVAEVVFWGVPLILIVRGICSAIRKGQKTIDRDDRWDSGGNDPRALR